ncbi:MAG: isocitrate lyase/phosphoenolpyruvate mutase family protein [Gammaproteobacteria bacterium]|nr:isocitrate lyase/phosphoenolpyruvate mutase family protein [Gammaproteobacteria bacterium]MDE2349240.1 isocitrate lyase/phosphoenolpyruvate mutase family protein [Gammaproteobacteria bacterium]
MTSPNPGVDDKRRAFRRLHEHGCFVIPNPWDVGSALALQSLGFPALASTSSGFAWSQGRADGALSRDQVLEHLRALVAATRVPVNADFESGYAPTAAGVAESVRLAIDTGVAGLSIEDASGVAAEPLHTLDVSVERIEAARRAIDRAGVDVLLVGRSEGFIRDRPDLEETIRRLRAYADAGADCLYAPGVRTRDEIAAVVAAVAPKPVNVLIGGASPLSVSDLAALGVRRISVGGALARAAWTGFLDAARRIAVEGRFDALGSAMPHAALDALFSNDP